MMILKQWTWKPKEKYGTVLYHDTCAWFINWKGNGIVWFANVWIISDFFTNSFAEYQIIESFAVFAGAFFMRPLGGRLFGYIDDKYHYELVYF